MYDIWVNYILIPMFNDIEKIYRYKTKRLNNIEILSFHAANQYILSLAKTWKHQYGGSLYCSMFWWIGNCTMPLEFDSQQFTVVYPITKYTSIVKYCSKFIIFRNNKWWRSNAIFVTNSIRCLIWVRCTSKIDLPSNIIATFFLTSKNKGRTFAPTT